MLILVGVSDSNPFQGKKEKKGEKRDRSWTNALPVSSYRQIPYKFFFEIYLYNGWMLCTAFFLTSILKEIFVNTQKEFHDYEFMKQK